MPLHSNKVNFKADNIIEGQFRKANLVFDFIALFCHIIVYLTNFWDRVIVDQGRGSILTRTIRQRYYLKDLHNTTIAVVPIILMINLHSTDYHNNQTKSYFNTFGNIQLTLADSNVKYPSTRN